MSGYRSSTSTAFSGLSSLAATAPAGYQAHDYLVAFLTQDANTTITLPSGGSGNTAWARLSTAGSNPSSQPDGQLFEVYELKDATGTDSFTWLSSNTGGCIIQVLAFSGMDNATASVLATPTVSTAHNTSPISCSVTGLTAPAGWTLVLALDTDQENTATDTWSFGQATGYTQRHTAANSDWCGLTTQTLDNWSGGATGAIAVTATRTAGTNTAGYGGYLLAIPALSAAPKGRTLLGVG